MEIYLLSQRGIFSGSAYGFIFELEDLLQQICDCNILAPKARALTIWSQQNKRSYSNLLKNAIASTAGLFQPIDPQDFQSKEQKHLLIICLNGAGLNMLSSIPNWRKQFDTVSAYVIDAWLMGAYPRQTYQLDHLFVPTLEAIGELEKKFKIPVSLIPFGANVLLHGGASKDRPIDVMSFGRTPVEYHRELSNRFNHPESNYLYYRHPELERQWDPVSDRFQGRVDHEYRLLFHKMMNRSKIVLAFDALFDTDQLYGANKVNSRPWKFRHSVLSLRWIEACSAGCAILGKRPTTVLADQILNWDDVTVELPENPSHWLEFTQQLLADTDRLAAIHNRNYRESLARHDWRYRIRDMFLKLQFELPGKLVEELYILAEHPNASLI